MRFSPLALVLAVGLLATAGCGNKESEAEAPQPISANINNNAPEARNAPVAKRESPAALAGQLGARGLKPGPK